MLVNHTNAANAVWQPYSSTNITVPLDSGDGICKVLVGLRGWSGDSHQTSLGTELTLNHVAPTLTVTHPAAGTVAVPMIQPQGQVSAASSKLTHDVRHATGILTHQQGCWQPVFFSPNRLPGEFTKPFGSVAGGHEGSGWRSDAVRCSGR